MFDIGYSELLLIAVVTLLVVGPKDLPRVLRTVGQWMGRARGMARHFRSGVDAMIRESELEEMNKQWAAQNAAIMAGTPVVDDPDDIADCADAQHRTTLLPHDDAASRPQHPAPDDLPVMTTPPELLPNVTAPTAEDVGPAASKPAP